VEFSVRTNFGGSGSIDDILARFFKRVALQDEENYGKMDVSPLGLVKASLSGGEGRFGSVTGRYLLIMTEGYSGFHILFDTNTLDKASTVVIFGSGFPSDQEYTQVCRNINRIKVCMETGRTVVLLNLKSLYASLYDMLNQYYTEFGGQRYVDLGLGSHRVKCRVHPKFRLVVVAEKEDVYENYEIPLVNRLEKHIITMMTILNPAQQQAVSEIKRWIAAFCQVTDGKDSSRRFPPEQCFIGLSDNLIASLVLRLSAEVNPESLLDEAKERLLWICTPDAVLRAQSSPVRSEYPHLRDIYFRKQSHFDFRSFLQSPASKTTSGWALITTYARLLAPEASRAVISQSLQFDRAHVDVVMLQAFDTELQFAKKVQAFFDSCRRSGSPQALVIQCEEGQLNANLIACSKYIVQSYTNIPSALVYFIVQLSRSGHAGQGTEFTTSFDGVWQPAHLDSLTAQSMVGLRLDLILTSPEQLSLGHILSQTATATSSFINLHAILEASVRLSLGRINYSQRALAFANDLRGFAGVITSRIKNLVQLIKTDRQFYASLEKKVIQMIAQRDERMGDLAGEWITDIARNSRLLGESGSFQDALSKKVLFVISDVLAQLLAACDQYSNLDLCQPETSQDSRSLWLACLENLNIFSVAYQQLSSNDVVLIPSPNTKLAESGFQASFPFSWGVFELSQRLYPTAVTLSNSNAESVATALRRLLQQNSVPETLLLDPGPGRTQVSGALQRYLSDFISYANIQAPRQAGPELEVAQHVLIQTLLETAVLQLEEVSGLDLPTIHVAFNFLKTRLTFYSLLGASEHFSQYIIAISNSFQESQFLQVWEQDRAAVEILIGALDMVEFAEKSRIRWTAKLEALKPVIEGLMIEMGRDQNVPAADLGKLEESWAKLRIMNLFISCVFPPRSREEALLTQVDNSEPLCKTFWALLKKATSLSSKEFLDGVIVFLVGCQNDYCEQFFPYGIECVLCTSMALEPIQLPCGHVFCNKEECLTPLKDQAMCPVCMSPRDPVFVYETTEVNRRKSVLVQNFRRICTDFFVESVVHMIFSPLHFATLPTGRQRSPVALEPDAAKLLLEIVFDRNKSFSQHQDLYLENRAVVRLFLLQHLLEHQDRGQIVSEFQASLQNFVLQGNLSEVYTLFVQCIEDTIHQKFSHMTSSQQVAYATEELLVNAHRFIIPGNNNDITANPLAFFETVAGIRAGLIVASNEVFAFHRQLPSALTRAQLTGIFGVLKKLGTERLDGDEDLLPKTFFLKQLLGRFGPSILAELAQDPEIITLIPWLPVEVTTLKASDTNAIYGEQYITVSDAIERGLTKRNTAALEAWLNANQAGSGARGQWRLVLLAILRHAYLDSPGPIPDEARELVMPRLLAGDPILQQPVFKALLQGLLSHTLGDAVIQGKPTPEVTLAIGLAVHFSLALFDASNLFDPLRRLFSDPANLDRTFLPTMPEDFLLEAMHALGGKWYTCPKGHPYFITECGRANQEFVCSCGERIGGASHVLISTNVELQNPQDRSQHGHILGDPATRTAQTSSERSLPSASVALVRAMMHSLLFIGGCVNPATLPARASLIKVATPQSPLKFYLDHLLCDLRSVAHHLSKNFEDAVLVGHLLARNIVALEEENSPRTRYAGDVALATKETRNNWEQAIGAAIFDPFLRGVDEELTRAKPLINQQQGARVKDLLELTPHGSPFWRFRTLVSIDQFQQKFLTSTEKAEGRCQILDLFLRQEPLLRHLRHLPALIGLQNLLFSTFEGRIDPKDAQKLTLGEAREQILLSQRAEESEIDRLIAAFVEAFTAVKHLINNHVPTSLRLSDKQLAVAPSLESPLSLLLPSKRGASVMSSIIAFLAVHVHNEFLHRYYAILKGDASGSFKYSIQLRDVTEAHLEVYDLDKELLPFILSFCDCSLATGQGTVLSFNFPAIERELISRFLGSKPFVEVETRVLSNRRTGVDLNISNAVNSKIAQAACDRATLHQITEELGSVQSLSDALASVSLCLNFLQATGGKATDLLDTFMANVLVMEEKDRFQSQTARKRIQLQHVVSLWKFLDYTLAVALTRNGEDVYDGALLEYREKLPDAQSRDLARILGDVDPENFVLSLRELMILHLARQDEESVFKPVWSLRDVFENLELPSHRVELPPSILLAHTVSVWKVCVSLLNNA